LVLTFTVTFTNTTTGESKTEHWDKRKVACAGSTYNTSVFIGGRSVPPKVFVGVDGSFTESGIKVDIEITSCYSYSQKEPARALTIGDSQTSKCNAPWDFISSIAAVYSDGLLAPDFYFNVLPEDVHCGLKRRREDSSSSTSAPSSAQVPVHKFILIARSPVFRAMLSGSMQEAHAKRIEIVDFTAPVVCAFVRFLYSDACTKEALKEHAWELLAMGDKYEVTALVSLCEAHLVSALTVENVVSALMLADAHRAAQLRSEALKFIQAHAMQLAEEKVERSGGSGGVGAELDCEPRQDAITQVNSSDCKRNLILCD
jgi:hypothetical protein